MQGGRGGAERRKNKLDFSLGLPQGSGRPGQGEKATHRAKRSENKYYLQPATGEPKTRSRGKNNKHIHPAKRGEQINSFQPAAGGTTDQDRARVKRFCFFCCYLHPAAGKLQARKVRQKHTYTSILDA